MRVLDVVAVAGLWFAADAAAVVNEIHVTYGGRPEATYSCDGDWVETDGRIARMDADGGNFDDVLNGVRHVTGIDCADGRLYWAENDDRADPALKSANLDGSDAQTIAEGLALEDAGLFELQGIAVDPFAKTIYLTDLQHFLSKIRSDGTDTDTVSAAPDEDDTWDVAIDRENNHIYFTHWFGDGQTVSRIDVDGNNETVLVDRIGFNAGPRGIALDLVNGKMYWTEYDEARCENGGIWRANLDGSEIELVLMAGGAPNDIEIDVDDQRIYWTESYTGNVRSANTDGSDVQLVIEDLARAAYLVLDCQVGPEGEPPTDPSLKPRELPASNPWGLAVLISLLGAGMLLWRRTRAARD